MDSGTSAAKEPADFIDLDSASTELIEVALVGKALLFSRSSLTTFSLTTFSVANDVAESFAFMPVLILAAHPRLQLLDVTRPGSARSAIL